ncbi:hypothetical protein M9H77_14083 [Catharanthus roseus]|uniref:Uncharacterized protein n=1 Tax=Catharanthus roseus TaxID=4058 RepID=A0ACC0BMB6_CATRO|nr:hypothetical protein M9H77_14083 [Catharanthus roseus]
MAYLDLDCQTGHHDQKTLDLHVHVLQIPQSAASTCPATRQSTSAPLNSTSTTVWYGLPRTAARWLCGKCLLNIMLRWSATQGTANRNHAPAGDNYGSPSITPVAMLSTSCSMEV